MESVTSHIVAAASAVLGARRRARERIDVEIEVV